uniref:Bacteriophage T5 Orf172 DNA-binding domain-containing protein n=1 Tax=Siphoviridae sp. cteEQ43 TaxID=2827905 RepID=A0A8S5TCA7_9CAUD|nr:MAG TPA: hypothetical protein [Siphoviridae sp. cteEQ43]
MFGLKAKYDQQKAELEYLQKYIADFSKQRDDLIANIASKQKELDELHGKIGAIEQMQEYGVPLYHESLDELENRLFEIQADIEHCVAVGLWRVNSPYALNGSTSKGAAIQKSFGSGLVYCINSYLDSKEKSLTPANIERNKDLVAKKFDVWQKKANDMGLSLNAKYVKLRIEQMDVKLDIKIAKQEEKARLREEKRRLKEQEQLLADIAREEARLERERKAMDIAFAKALTDDEREEIKAKMEDIDKRMDDLTYRRDHSKAGWLYVISSPSLPGICKVGVTRRINPTIRVRELSSSSLPFPFVANCFVFSDDCFELENNMHHYFDDRRVAANREFFSIEPKEAIDVLRDVFNQEVHFIDIDDEQEEDANGET